MAENGVVFDMHPPRTLLAGVLFGIGLLTALAGCAADPADAVVGTWVVDLEHSTLPELPPALAPMAEGAAKEYSLRLERDGSFQVNLWRKLEGTWKLESDTVFLTPKDGKGTNLLGELEFKVLRQEQRLQTGMDSPLGKANLQFKRGAEPEAKP